MSREPQGAARRAAKSLARSRIHGYSLASSLAGMPQKPSQSVPLEQEDEEEQGPDYALSLAVNSREEAVASAWTDYAIRIYDVRTGIQAAPLEVLQAHTDRLTGLTFGESAANQTDLFSCAEDGRAVTWDLRTGAVVQEFSAKKPARALASLAVGCDNQLVVAGTEEDEVSRILFWDRRSGKQLGQYVESHAESISQLAFNPASKTRLASGSMDGLLCYFDITKPDEDSALLSVLNAESCISRIGFFGPHAECMFCLTHSETLSLFHAESAQTMAEFSNVRERLAAAGAPSDYLVDCCYVEGARGASQGQTLVLVSGDHEGRMFLSDVTLVGLRKLCGLQDSFGHTSDVRAATFLKRNPVDGVPIRLLTAGESGVLCDWRHQAASVRADPVAGKSLSRGAARRRRQL